VCCMRAPRARHHYVVESCRLPGDCIVLASTNCFRIGRAVTHCCFSPHPETMLHTAILCALASVCMWFWCCSWHSWLAWMASRSAADVCGHTSRWQAVKELVAPHVTSASPISSLKVLTALKQRVTPARQKWDAGLSPGHAARIASLDPCRRTAGTCGHTQGGRGSPGPQARCSLGFPAASSARNSGSDSRPSPSASCAATVASTTCAASGSGLPC